jgi:hypothetical protein
MGNKKYIYYRIVLVIVYVTAFVLLLYYPIPLKYSYVMGVMAIIWGIIYSFVKEKYKELILIIVTCVLIGVILFFKIYFGR